MKKDGLFKDGRSFNKRPFAVCADKGGIMPLDLTIFPGMAEAVCRWFAENGRSLPWRETADPYRIWLSEIMLQQTRIEAVIPYYRRFLEAFPDPAALAAADDGVLMKLWEGLGYYSRARNLKKAAQIIVRDYGGALPPDAELLGKLPGIGEYTAGAVASVAFGLPEPAVDGNVLRVVARLTAMEDDVLLPAVKKAVSDALREIYPMGRDAALFTEGLMELGEVVCTPKSPDCGLCPLRAMCRAAAQGDVSRYPVRSPKKERRIEERTVFLLRSPDGRYLLRKRPAEGLLAGLWEFPGLPGKLNLSGSGPGSGFGSGYGEQISMADPGEKTDFIAPEDALRRLLPCLSEAENYPAVTGVDCLGEAKHLFTHVEWRMTGWEIGLAAVPGEREEEGVVWADPETIRGELAVPSAFRAWMKKLR